MVAQPQQEQQPEKELALVIENSLEDRVRLLRRLMVERAQKKSLTAPQPK